MYRRIGILVTAAGAITVVLVGGPLLACPALAATPSVVVRAGDTLSAIAARHGTSVGRLVALNGLANPDRIIPGQWIVLPAGTAAAQPSSVPGTPTAAAPSATRVHTVQWGEHLTGIAARYRTSIDAIVRLNRLTDANQIYAGQRLLIPVDRAAAPTPAAVKAPSQSVIHRVAPGENLTVIAGRYRTSVAAIVALNHLVNASYIRAGQRLQIPVPAVTTVAAPSSSQGDGHLPAETLQRMRSRASVRAEIVAEARRAGVPAALALALAWQESGWQQGVVSSAGAVGVMQLLPSTAAWVGSAMLARAVDVHDRRQNIRAGVTLLKHYLLRYRGDLRKVLAAYYQGQRSVDEHGILPVSRPYIASILALEELIAP